MHGISREGWGIPGVQWDDSVIGGEILRRRRGCGNQLIGTW